MNSRTSAIHVKHTVIIRATTASMFFYPDPSALLFYFLTNATVATQQGPKSISIYRVPSTSSSLAKVAGQSPLPQLLCINSKTRKMNREKKIIAVDEQ
ncbi:hypothetical protein Dimus_019951 [Dionaea muscipula]